jgi:hypothetical protein
MTPAEVATKFRQYIDELDQTFVSDTDVETYLDDGYREFRNMVCDINPMIYNATEDVALSGVREYDLDPVFMGGSPTAASGRLVRLNSIIKKDSSGLVTDRLGAVSNVRALDATPSSYYLSGTILKFTRKLTGTYTIEYVPVGAVDWTVGPDTFIDNLTPFHDLIALLAYRQYAIVDGAESEPILRQTATRLGEFQEYLQARAFDGYDYVQSVPWYG